MTRAEFKRLRRQALDYSEVGLLTGTGVLCCGVSAIVFGLLLAAAVGGVS